MHVGLFMGNTLVDTDVDLTDLGVGVPINGPNPLIDGLPASNVFDNNPSTSARLGLSPPSDCWFGWDFGLGQERWTHGITLRQYNNPARAITAVLYQSTADLVSWTTIGAFNPIVSPDVQTFHCERARGRAFRVVANVINNPNAYWEPMEFQLLQTVLK